MSGRFDGQTAARRLAASPMSSVSFHGSALPAPRPTPAPPWRPTFGTSPAQMGQDVERQAQKVAAIAEKADD